MFFIKIYIKESNMNFYHTSIQMCGQYCILAPQKIQELQQEMTEEGMHNAANLLQDCLSPGQGGGVKNRSRGKSIDQNINPIDDSNVNGNSNKNKQPGQMPSEVTIYDQAVEKCFSSSSEENLGFSDDSLNNELYHLTGEVRQASDR